MTQEPFYFGEASRRLFGIYHPPEGPAGTGAGVVLCYPIGQARMRAPETFARWAAKLAAAGLHVLRFDYLGCGDSAGDEEQWGISQWLADTAAAIEELKDGCGLHRIGLAGVRLGASLAMLTGAERKDVNAMVLWDPVLNGRQYIQELLAVHREQLGEAGQSPIASAKGGMDSGVLGFSFSDRFVGELDSLDLRRRGGEAAGDLLLIESDTPGPAGDTAFRHRLAKTDVRLRYLKNNDMPDPTVWTTKSYEQVPTKVLASAVSWCAEVLL